MFYDGIIFDLDNTLYDYDKSHNQAINAVINFIIENDPNKNNFDFIYEKYRYISNITKFELYKTASSHNKSIYFKQLIEHMNLNYELLTEMNNIYWNTFYKNMICYNGVEDFLTWNKNLKKKIGILTNYEIEYQIIKLKKLNLLKYIDVITTSEEVGIEKPSMQMYQTILRKMNLTADKVIVIGDNYKDDIQGAKNVNIFGYLFNKNNNLQEKLTLNSNDFIEFSSFVKLKEKFIEIYIELIKFQNISRYSGERFDLVQAGGGNSSVKIDDWMFIKASGYNMTNVNISNGYAIVNNKNLLQDIEANDIKGIINYNIVKNNRASIETYMHCVLKKYTLHLHPIQINKILISKQAKKICKQIYPNSLTIDYITPGIKVCNKIVENYNNEKVIFLINHGIVITSNDINEIYSLLEDVINKFEEHIGNYNFDKYKKTNVISKIINENYRMNNITYLCEDQIVNNYLTINKNLFKTDITFPDALIYCGIKILFVNDNLSQKILEYKNNFNELPKIIVINNNIYINSHAIIKCKEIENVLKANLIVLDTSYEKNYLDWNEVCFLNNWDAEKYRKYI